MESVLFGLCLIAVVWLITWAERDHSQPTKNWWPFEMKGFPSSKPAPRAATWRDVARRQRRG